MVKDHLAEANELFRSGFNCSQAVLAVFSEEFGLPVKSALKIADPFGRGMGGRGLTCGALTGAMMVIGLKYGTTSADNADSLRIVREKTRQLIESFEKDYGTTLCSELTGYDQKSLNGPELMAMLPHFHNTCPRFLDTVITFLEEEL
ncbi:MAG: C_GCAxxG_C_C family protein [Bacteroidales bacterium]|nr:C_GCAxxG_C_C family protein [Bacteroidales bacterium]